MIQVCSWNQQNYWKGEGDSNYKPHLLWTKYFTDSTHARAELSKYGRIKRNYIKSMVSNFIFFYFVKKTQHKILLKCDVYMPVNIWVICEDGSTTSFLGCLLLLLQVTALNCLCRYQISAVHLDFFKLSVRLGDISGLRRRVPLTICLKTSVEEATGVITMYTLLLGFDLSSCGSHDCHYYCLMASDQGIPPCQTCSLEFPLPYWLTMSTKAQSPASDPLMLTN